MHSHEFTVGGFGSAAARLAGIPHFITIHGSLYCASAWNRCLATRAGAEYDLSQSVERYAARFARRLGVDQPA